MSEDNRIKAIPTAEEIRDTQTDYYERVTLMLDFFQAQLDSAKQHGHITYTDTKTGAQQTLTVQNIQAYSQILTALQQASRQLEAAASGLPELIEKTHNQKQIGASIEAEAARIQRKLTDMCQPISAQLQGGRDLIHMQSIIDNGHAPNGGPIGAAYFKTTGQQNTAGRFKLRQYGPDMLHIYMQMPLKYALFMRDLDKSFSRALDGAIEMREVLASIGRDSDNYNEWQRGAELVQQTLYAARLLPLIIKMNNPSKHGIDLAHLSKMLSKPSAESLGYLSGLLQRLDEQAYSDVLGEVAQRLESPDYIFSLQNPSTLKHDEQSPADYMSGWLISVGGLLKSSAAMSAGERKSSRVDREDIIARSMIPLKDALDTSKSLQRDDSIGPPQTGTPPAAYSETPDMSAVDAALEIMGDAIPAHDVVLDDDVVAAIELLEDDDNLEVGRKTLFEALADAHDEGRLTDEWRDRLDDTPRTLIFSKNKDADTQSPDASQANDSEHKPRTPKPGGGESSDV